VHLAAAAKQQSLSLSLSRNRAQEEQEELSWFLLSYEWLPLLGPVGTLVLSANEPELRMRECLSFSLCIDEMSEEARKVFTRAKVIASDCGQ